MLSSWSCLCLSSSVLPKGESPRALVDGLRPTRLPGRDDLVEVDVPEKRRQLVTEEKTPGNVSKLTGGEASLARELGIATESRADPFEERPRALGNGLPTAHPLGEHFQEGERIGEGFFRWLGSGDTPVKHGELRDVGVGLDAQNPRSSAGEHDVDRALARPLSHLPLHRDRVTLLEEEVEPIEEAVDSRFGHALLVDLDL